MKVLKFVLVVLISACAQKINLKEPDLMEENVAITDELQAGRYDQVYFSAQPKLQDWKNLKDQGFKHVINLRTSQEYDHEPHFLEVQKQELNYTQVPMAKEERLTPRTLSMVTEVLKTVRAGEDKVLIHCASKKRAAYWGGAHFYWDHNYSESEALAAAKALGLGSGKWELRLREFMARYKKATKL